MKFGLALAVQHPPGDAQDVRFREHVEQVRLARAVGFDSVWASQHYLAEPYTYFQPLPTLARVAAEAEGMALGTGCLLLPLHQPVDLAEQTATLDVISGGRLIVGVGLGYRDAENAAFGQDPRQRLGRFLEAFELLERLWTGEPVTFAGRHFSLREVRISMRPLQRPRPALWIAANSDPGIRRAARLGDTWLINPHTTLPTLERQLALFREERARAGRPPAPEIPVTRELYVAPDHGTALAEAAPLLSGKYAAYRRWEQDRALPAGETFAPEFAELLRDRFVVGDPRAVRDELARYRERLGATMMVVRLQWPGMEQARVLRAIRLLGEQVFPHLR